MYATHPEMAHEWEEHTPAGTKLPERVKKSYAHGAADALERLGFKQASEEIRLKIPRREFHGWSEAFRKNEGHAKKADGGTADGLAAAFDKLENVDPAGRVSDMGQPQSIGTV